MTATDLSGFSTETLEEEVKRRLTKPEIVVNRKTGRYKEEYNF